MSLFDRLKPTKDESPPIIIIYGVDGIGKSTLAAEAKDVVYLGTPGEHPPSDVDIEGDDIRDFRDIKDALLDLLELDHPFKWVIVDSLDGLEPMVWEETCDIHNKPNIEAFGFGKGYAAADEPWIEIVDIMLDLKKAGIGIIILAHPSIERFDSPMTEPYNRYTIKIHKRANAIVRERADIVAFMNHKVKIEETKISRDKSVSHAKGNARMIFLTGSPSFDAKNRYSMPDYIEYKKGKGFEEMSKYFPAPTGKKGN